eukprot:12792477-Alexandrium_andersonii.AAC.1
MPRNLGPLPGWPVASTGCPRKSNGQTCRVQQRWQRSACAAHPEQTAPRTARKPPVSCCQPAGGS